MINRVICPPLFLDILNFIVGAEHGAERAENRAERSAAVRRELQKNDGAERSAEREVAERERSGERGAGVTEIHRVSEKKTSTHIIGYKLRNSCLILIIFDIKIPHII